ELSVRIVGSPATTDAFREAAMRLPAPNATIRTLAPREAAGLAMPVDHPAAYVCVTGTCGPPVHDPAEMRAAYDAVSARA
ncbi:MAG TPA: hypothetical protein VN909_01480, partial [Candidatus Dormibacteraeota bacterium]|nr:hypothetical protein [Candidatus Dormibacteraeota bacterium]